MIVFGLILVSQLSIEHETIKLTIGDTKYDVSFYIITIYGKRIALWNNN